MAMALAMATRWASPPESSERIEQLDRAPFGLGARHVRDLRWCERYVVEHGEMFEKIMELEDHPDALP